MKFKFPLNTLMKARNIRKDETERDYRIALSKSVEQRTKLQNMKDDLVRAREEMQSVRESGGKLTPALMSIEEFVQGQKIKIQNQSRTVKGLEDIAEQKRLILVEA